MLRQLPRAGVDHTLGRGASSQKYVVGADVAPSSSSEDFSQLVRYVAGRETSGGTRRLSGGSCPLLAVPTPSTEEDTMFDDQRVELLPERTTLKSMRGGGRKGGGGRTVNVVVIANVIIARNANN